MQQPRFKLCYTKWSHCIKDWKHKRSAILYSMFHLLMNHLHKIVILYFFGLGLILWISRISNHIKIEQAISLQNLNLWVIWVHWIAEMSINNASYTLIL